MPRSVVCWWVVPGYDRAFLRQGGHWVISTPTLKPHPSVVSEQFRPWRPYNRPARALRTPDSIGDQIGGAKHVASMPTPVAIAPKGRHGIAMPQQLGGRQRPAPGHPERPADLPFDPSIPGIRERRPLGAHPFHVSRVSAPTTHSNLLLASFAMPATNARYSGICSVNSFNPALRF